MRRDNRNGNTVPYNLASLIRGLYGRVARQLKVDPSYVSRVARGERRSDDIEATLERELKGIMALMKTNHNGNGRDGHNHSAVKMKPKKKVLARVKEVSLRLD